MGRQRSGGQRGEHLSRRCGASGCCCKGETESRGRSGGCLSGRRCTAHRRDHPSPVGIHSRPEEGAAGQQDLWQPLPAPSLPTVSPRLGRRQRLPSEDVTGVRAGAGGELRDPAASLLGPHHVHGLQQVVEARGGAQSPGAIADAVGVASRALLGDRDALGRFAAGRRGSAARGARAGARRAGWA